MFPSNPCVWMFVHFGQIHVQQFCLLSLMALNRCFGKQIPHYLCKTFGAMLMCAFMYCSMLLRAWCFFSQKHLRGVWSFVFHTHRLQLKFLSCQLIAHGSGVHRGANSWVPLVHLIISMECKTICIGWITKHLGLVDEAWRNWFTLLHPVQMLIQKGWMKQTGSGWHWLVVWLILTTCAFYTKYHLVLLSFAYQVCSQGAGAWPTMHRNTLEASRLL